jgi:hypothetical protein
VRRRRGREGGSKDERKRRKEGEGVVEVEAEEESNSIIVRKGLWMSKVISEADIKVLLPSI